MKLADLNDLFLHELKDLYDAEHQLLKALPRMAKAASSPELRAAFEEHLAQTEDHVERLESVFEAFGEKPDRETCVGMKGLIAEGERLMKDNAEPDVMDAGLISAAQRVEHYEIAAYGTLVTWAGTSGIDGAAELLQATLDEEKLTDQKLSAIAESSVNLEAETGDMEEEEEAEESTAGQGSRSPSQQRRAGRGNNSRQRTRSRKSRSSRSRR
jgi:ferritin-like metal-binding protein YciE